MSMLANLELGFSVALAPTNLLYAFLGTLLGTAVGVLPGIGPIATFSLLLPLTYGLDPATAIIMLAGIYYGAQYGGSTTAILINLPGEATSVVTTIDGYQMARKGQAGLALATAAIGSFIAGTLATIVVAVAAPLLAEVSLAFGPPEYFSLMVFGLVSAVILAHGSVVKAMGMIVIGMMIGTVGIDAQSGDERFTFGIPWFVDGIDFVIVAMGVFGLAETIGSVEREEGQRSVMASFKDLWPSPAELRSLVPASLRGTALGSAFGVLPGGGPVLASFASYTLEKKLSRTPERFGKGAIEGVAGPESANNAAAQTAFIPLLSLGLPSTGAMALLIGALMIHGLSPGPQLMTQRPDLVWGVIASMWVANAMLLVLNLPLIGVWVKLLSYPQRLLYPAILLFCCIGLMSLSNSSFHVLLACAFAAGAYVLNRARCEPAPMLLGMILGPLLEENLRRSLQISLGDPMVFFRHPISLSFLVLTVLLVVVLAAPRIRSLRSKAFAEE